jgi:hypothetical protein
MTRSAWINLGNPTRGLFHSTFVGTAAELGGQPSIEWTKTRSRHGPWWCSTTGWRGVPVPRRGSGGTQPYRWAPCAGSGGASGERQRRSYLRPLAREAPLPLEHSASSTVGLLVEMAMSITPCDRTPNGQASAARCTASAACRC